MLAAIEALSELQVIKCMVLADMGELGEKSGHSHIEVLTKASQKMEKVFLIGKSSQSVTKAKGWFSLRE